MAFCVSHETALEFWRKAHKKRMPHPDVLDEVPSFVDAPCGEAWQRIFGRLGAMRLASPIHVLVGDRALVRVNADVLAHVQITPPPPRAFCQISEGLYVVSPAFCLVQMAKRLSRTDLLLAAYELCSAYYRDEYSATGISKADPVMQAAEFRSLARDARGIHGAKEARIVANYILDKAESPREVALALLLCLPTKMGGYGLALPQLNAVLKVDSYRAATDEKSYRPDFLWGSEGIILEYDGGLVHSGDARVSFDKRRRNDLIDMGYKVIVADKSYFESAQKFSILALQLGKQLGLREKPGRFDATFDRIQLFNELRERGY